MHQIYIRDWKSQSLKCVWISLCCCSTQRPDANSISPAKNFPVFAELIESPSGKHKAGTSIPTSSLSTGSTRGTAGLSSLLAGCYLEDSWKTLEYLQDCSKLQWVGINLVWETNETAKFKHCIFFFAHSWLISYQVFYFFLTQSLFLLQFPSFSKPFEYKNLTLALIKEVLITVNSQVILIQRKNINKE